MLDERKSFPTNLRVYTLLSAMLILVGGLVACDVNSSQIFSSHTTVAAPSTVVSSIPLISITAVDYGYEMPTKLSVQAGLIDIALVNNGTEAHQAQVAQLNAEVTSAEVFDKLVTHNQQAAAFSLLTFVGGSDTVVPGYGQESILNLSVGQYVLLCFVVSPDGISHIEKGMIHFFTVSGGSSTLQRGKTLSADGEVEMNDFSYTLPAIFSRSQPLMLRVVNQGLEPHELNIVKLQPDKGVQDILNFFQSPSGSPPFEEMGGLAALHAGGAAWIKVHLEPGRYAAFSYILDIKTGQSQLSLGMITAFQVR